MASLLRSLLLAFCAWGSLALLSAQTPANTPPAPAAKPDTTYVLKPDDMLELSVFEEADLATTTRVLKTGEAVFPLIGSVHVGGQTLDDATRRIRDLYDEKYLVNPKVSLTVTSYGQQLISVLGSVKSPGTIQLPSSGSIDLASAVALAGGLHEDADTSGISVVRAGGASATYTKDQVLAGGAAVKLGVGDRVVVGQSRYIGKTVTILGKVMRPGPVEFPVDGALDLVGAISRAGGFHELANMKKVTVNRNGKVHVIDVRKLSESGTEGFKLVPGDVVSVPERIF
jgi:polysaccharide export outer membrane protein